MNGFTYLLQVVTFYKNKEYGTHSPYNGNDSEELLEVVMYLCINKIFA